MSWSTQLEFPCNSKTLTGRLAWSYSCWRSRWERQGHWLSDSYTQRWVARVQVTCKMKNLFAKSCKTCICETLLNLYLRNLAILK